MCVFVYTYVYTYILITIEEGDVVNMEIKPETQGDNTAPNGETPPADAPAQGEAKPETGSEAPRRTDELDWGHTDGADGFTEGAQEAHAAQGSDQEHKPLTSNRYTLSLTQTQTYTHL